VSVKRPDPCKRADGKPKTAWGERQDADRALQALLRQRKPLDYVVVYRCPTCHLFHIGTLREHGRTHRRKQRGSWS
jgi:hypothetical protein